MIDVHIHILPAVDDGSFSMEESLRMARMAVGCGVTEMAVTPHCNRPDQPEVLWADELRLVLADFKQELARQKIPLQLHMGMEIYGFPDVPQLFHEGRLTTLADSRYPLIEFPFTDYGQEATQVLGQVLDLGYRPLIAHPERYVYTQRHPELLNIWADMGCLLQINRGSLMGRFGGAAQALSFGLLERGFVTCVATDAHRSTVRTPLLSDAYQIVREAFGTSYAKLLMEENPRRILQDQEILRDTPDWF